MLIFMLCERSQAQFSIQIPQPLIKAKQTAVNFKLIHLILQGLPVRNEQ